MLKNYLKTAWRNLKANKFYTVINVCGLAVGLAAGIMLLLWVQDELSYDKFNRDYKNIYQLSAHLQANGKEVTWPGVPGPLAVFSQSLSDVKAVVRIYEMDDQVIASADRSKILDGFHTAYVDSSFLSIFDFKLLSGNKGKIFPDINSVLLTQTTAKKILGTEKAVNKAIRFHGKDFIVSGVLQDFPYNSSLRYDAVFPMGFYAQQFTAGGGNQDWKTIDTDLGNFDFRTFLKLRPATDIEKTQGSLISMYQKSTKGELGQVAFQMENLADIHLVEPDGDDSALRMVQVFMLTAILLLIIAAINYVNLSTARSLIRAKEVSIRKITGAGRLQLFFQFITETLLLFCIAICLSVFLIGLLLPLYNNISGKEMHFSLMNPRELKTIGYTVVGTLLAASIYPALLLSSFRPIQALKGMAVPGIGMSLFRKILVVFQFSISIILIAGTLIISRQMQYVRSKNLGYDKSYVFTVPLPSSVVDHIKAVKNELQMRPGILAISTSNIYDISNYANATGDIEWKGKPANSNMVIGQAVVDKDFIPTMKMQFKEGSNFSGTPADSSHYILNEAAVVAMGLKPPYIGQQITFHQRKGTILGVLKNFNFKSLKEAVTPILLYSWNWKGNILYVRTTATKAQAAIAAVENQYKRYAGDVPFSYSFVDKQFANKYKTDQLAGLLFNLFAGIAIFISCLGLLGLATFTTQRRTKEIGVRKVLGANVGNILRLITMDYLKLILIAIVIATPIAWLAMNKWLQNFAYRINISWWIFVVAGFMAIMIALITVSFQAIRAARANPVKSLRTE